MRYTNMMVRQLVIKCGLAFLILCSTSTAVLVNAKENCHVGSYRLADGSLVDIAPSDSGILRWRRFDGETGALHRGVDGVWHSTLGWTNDSQRLTVTFPPCAEKAIQFNGIAGKRIVFDAKDVAFESHGAKLAGRLVMPEGKGKVPVVVLIHGAEHDSALTSYFLQRMLPAEGIGAFVFDKRGTGISGGKYTQDFNLLADDDVAAVEEARELAGPRLGRIGYQGGSEAGWTVPLAVNRTRVDFAIVCFGLAVDVMDEDQESIELQMREKGYSQDVVSKALEVGRAAEDLFAADFTHGFREFDEVRERYSKESWFKDVRGDFTWVILSHSDSQLRAMAKTFNWHTPFYYDGMQTLRADKVPQLWILGGEDYEAPSAETSMRIKSLIADGSRFTLAYYPHAEHGMTIFETEPDGSRKSTVYEPGYFKMLADYARYGRLSGSYGDAVITYPRRSDHR